VRLKATLSPGDPIASEELASIFLTFYGSPAQSARFGFRVWVEGESDCRLLKLVARLGKDKYGVDMEEGLSITPSVKGVTEGLARP
jgi:hypothetical protein